MFCTSSWSTNKLQAVLHCCVHCPSSAHAAVRSLRNWLRPLSAPPLLHLHALARHCLYAAFTAASGAACLAPGLPFSSSSSFIHVFVLLVLLVLVLLVYFRF